VDRPLSSSGAHAVWLGWLFLSAGCAVIDVNHAQPLDPEQRFVLLPVENYSEAPQAGEKVEAILTTMLRARRLPVERLDPPAAEVAPELDEERRYQRGLESARPSGARYGVTGTVIEWRYKNGLDADPAVSISLRVVEVDSGKVVWSASGSRTGWGSDSLGAVAQVLLRDLVAEMKFTRSPDSE
jgi:curli biogenesis system outer membrane secretion channel CsgG